MHAIIKILIILCFIPMKNNAHDTLQKISFTWDRLPDFPNCDGLAGAYVGVSNNALIVAGGTNFPNNTRPWSNGKKEWFDTIYVLNKPNGEWKTAGHLPQASGYGVTLMYNNSVLCFGGGNATENFSSCIAINYKDGQINITSLPDMPVPLINACGVIINDKAFIAGGIETPTGKTTNHLFCLDLKNTTKGWSTLQSFPGTSRMLSTAGTLNGKLYVFGGVELQQVQGDTTLNRKYLNSCWMYDTATGWHQIAAMPYTLAAAPGPAFVADNKLYLFGGDDGANAERNNELKEKHPGFTNNILAYNADANKWSVEGVIPVDKKPDADRFPSKSLYAPVTTPLTIWNNKIIIAGGEVRPAVRTNKVLTATINK